MTTITCKIPKKLDAVLETLARRQRLSKSAVVRQALEHRLKKEIEAATPSAFDLVESLCGCLQGPSDLSVSDKHMEDFGA